MDDEELIDTPFDQGPFEAMLAERQYENTRNPMYLWKLIRACTAHGLPLPTVALEYLGDVAEKLLDSAEMAVRDDGDEATRIARAKTKENMQGVVFEAVFGKPSKGGISPLTRFAKDEQKFRAGMEMSKVMCERVVPVYGENGEAPVVKTVPGATFEEAIAAGKPHAKWMDSDRSFRRALADLDRPSRPHRKD